MFCSFKIVDDRLAAEARQVANACMSEPARSHMMRPNPRASERDAGRMDKRRTAAIALSLFSCVLQFYNTALYLLNQSSKVPTKMPQSQSNSSENVQHHKVFQVVFGADDGRIQPWREHWHPTPRGDTSDKLRGFTKGQDILLGGSSANDGLGETILFDSKDEVGTPSQCNRTHNSSFSLGLTPARSSRSRSSR
jgi:hypothetical protein